MGRTLGPIPLGTPITDPHDGTITAFMRARWQDLEQGWTQTGTVGVPFRRAGLNDVLPWTTFYTTLAAGRYRATWAVRKTTVDGVSSTVTPWLQWLDLARQQVVWQGPDLTADAIAVYAAASGMQMFQACAQADLQVFCGYASNTPGQMHYDIDVVLELLV